MADIKISQLSEAQLVSNTDVFPMTSNGVTMKAPASVLKDYTIGTTANSDLGADVSTQIHNLHGQVSNSGDAYSASKAYAVGDLCIYNNVLYRCITACSAGSWAINQSCFTPDTLTGAVNGKASVLSYPTVNSTSPTDVAVGSNERSLLVCIGGVASRCALFYIYSTSAGAASTFPINQGSAITVQESTNNIRVNSSSSSGSMIMKILLN